MPPRKTVSKPQSGRGRGGDNFLVAVKNVETYLRGDKILTSIDWTLRANENWALVGNNGSGKTTLLRLIYGEIIPVHGGEVYWFGKREQPALWEIRGKIGYVSAEYQANYDQNVTGLEVVESGLFSSIGLYKTVTRKQKRTALEWMDFLGIGRLASKRYRRMSYGEARRVLIARALVNHPSLLILDEPCNGLDIPSRETVLETVEKLARRATRVIYATHHVEEILPSITHVLYMKDGQIHMQGKKREMLRDETLSKALGCKIRLRKNSGRYWVADCGGKPKDLRK
ncbi:MAG: ATP-binding cassette domain-containing protein [Nitrospinae bacterium]|nr:ATP-binding cassette domain-containing protein [Nitrospinota bacterium]